MYFCEFLLCKKRDFWDTCKHYEFRNMKERIEHIIRSKNMTAAEFAEKLGIQASGLSHILSARNNPSLDFVLKLKNAFPEYNFDWLLLGVGPMTSYEQPVQPVTPRLDGGAPSSQLVDVVPEQFSLEFDGSKINGEPEEALEIKKGANNDPVKLLMIYSDGTFEVLTHRGK